MLDEKVKWPWQKKKAPVKKDDVTEILDLISYEITEQYCKALNNFLDKIIDQIAKKESIDREDVRQILAVGYSSNSKFKRNEEGPKKAREYYKKYKQIFDREYKQALFNLIRVMPDIKKLWFDFIEEYKKIPTSKTGFYRDQAKNYIKHLRVNDRKLAKDIISFDMIIAGKGMPSEEPYEPTQTYSYCISDYS